METTVQPSVPNTSKPRNIKPLVILIIVFIIITSLAIILQKRGLFSNQIALTGRALSPNILYLTQPVYSVIGKIDAVNGTILSVSEKIVFPQNNAPATTSSANARTLTFKVAVTTNTQINSVQTPGSPPNPTSPVSNSKLTLNDLQTGRMVIVTAKTDLRLLQGDQFEAQSITIIPAPTNMSGTILSISNNSLTISGVLPPNPLLPPTPNSDLPQPKPYTVNVDSNTTVARGTDKLTLADLKKDTQVNITADAEITSQSFRAKRIDVFIPINPSLLPPFLATPPAQLKP